MKRADAVSGAVMLDGCGLQVMFCIGVE